MKFGKRRKDADAPAGEPVVEGTSDPPPPAVTESWTVPSEELPGHTAGAADEPAPYVVAQAPAPEPSYAAPDAPSYAVPEAVVEGEAVEIPSEVPAQKSPPEPPPFVAPPPYVPSPPVPAPAAMPFPVASEPVAVVASGPSEHEAAVPLGAAAETFASGHGRDHHGPPPAPAWPEGVQELVAERPEVLVGAAFAGGILAAMILRRLGN